MRWHTQMILVIFIRGLTIGIVWENVDSWTVAKSTAMNESFSWSGYVASRSRKTHALCKLYCLVAMWKTEMDQCNKTWDFDDQHGTCSVAMVAEVYPDKMVGTQQWTSHLVTILLHLYVNGISYIWYRLIPVVQKCCSKRREG